MVNFALLKNPINWLTVILMILIASIAGHLALTYFGIEPATSESQ